jgi:ketosteroid isomerase-like protein
MPTLTEVPFTAQDQAALRGMVDTCARYINAGNWTAWAALYSEDGRLQPPNAPAITGRANLVAWGQAFPEIEALSFFNVELWGEGNIAYGTSGYTLKLKDLPPDTGKQLVVWRRSADRKWSVVAASFNSDLPMTGSNVGI